MTEPRDTEPPSSWDDKTDPDSLVGMRRALRENTRVCNAALEWSVKTYELVKVSTPVILAKEVRHAKGWAFAAVLISLVTFACELVRR